MGSIWTCLCRAIAALPRERLSLKQPTLLSVGHLIERKGHDLVVGALPHLPECHLLVVGRGTGERGAGRTFGAAGRGRSRPFLGCAAASRIAGQLYRAADALVLASSREGWANVLLEAMACGTPVVASNIWGNPEVVRSSAAGRLMPERSPAGVAQAVRALFGCFQAGLPRDDMPRSSAGTRHRRGRSRCFAVFSIAPPSAAAPFRHPHPSERRFRPHPLRRRPGTNSAGVIALSGDRPIAAQALQS